MIPGKVFFQSITISQQLSKRYQVYLLLNGIFYDKLKLFQSKYLCLTANDFLEVQMKLNSSLDQFSENQPNNQNYSIKDSFLKVHIPQGFKLIIQSKTITIKFQLNKRNNREQITINLTFEPVASFNRKKLGAASSQLQAKLGNTMMKNQTISIQSQHINQRHQKTSQFDDFIPENLFSSSYMNFMHSLQSTIQNNDLKISAPQLQRQRHARVLANQKTNQNLKALHIQHQQDQSSRMFQPQNEQTFPDQYPMDRPSVPRFNIPVNGKSSDIMQQQMGLTSRTHDHFIYRNGSPSNQKYLLNSPKNFNQTEVNFRSDEQQPGIDTLESLAYQRQQILGQLFGKFNTKNSK